MVYEVACYKGTEPGKASVEEGNLTITLREKELVQTTWEQVIPISCGARLFYDKLFELDPGARPLFTSDMEEQGRKLMQMITVAVQGLDDLDQTLPAVRGLGRRHADYGVQDEHYDTVDAALLRTLGQA